MGGLFHSCGLGAWLVMECLIHEDAALVKKRQAAALHWQCAEILMQDSSQ